MITTALKDGGNFCVCRVICCLQYRVSQNYVNTDLKDRIRTVVSSIPREMCVRALNGTVARWLMCVKHDGEPVETVL